MLSVKVGVEKSDEFESSEIHGSSESLEQLIETYGAISLLVEVEEDMLGVLGAEVNPGLVEVGDELFEG